MTDSVSGYNMYAYCDNDPVNKKDINGHSPIAIGVFEAVALIVLAVMGAEAIANNDAYQKAGMQLIDSVSRTLENAKVIVSEHVRNDSKKNKEQHYVYTLVNDDGEVKYVGRTIDTKKRAKAHEDNPMRAHLTMKVIQDEYGNDLKMDYYTARGLEQTLMLEYKTLDLTKRCLENNLINGVSFYNKNAHLYMAYGITLWDYLGNQVSNEVLNWIENIGK